MHQKTYLISTQSYRHEAHSNVEIPTQYGYLIETDFHNFMRLLRIATPTYSPYNERIKPGLRGLCAWKDKIYVASWNMIHIIDYASFQRVDSFSHPLMADVHGIHVDAQGIWVTSSLIDSILKFNWNLDLVGTLTTSSTPLYPQKYRKTVDLSQDYRLRGKIRQGFQSFHANHISEYNEKYMLVTGRGEGKRNGRVLQLDKATLQYRVWFKGLYGPHDGLNIAPGLFAFTETESSSVAIIKHSNWFGTRLHHRIKLPQKDDDRFWTRGLCTNTNGRLFVGKSVWRGDDRFARIIECSHEGDVLAEHHLRLDDYPECRIFQIIAAPTCDNY